MIFIAIVVISFLLQSTAAVEDAYLSSVKTIQDYVQSHNRKIAEPSGPTCSLGKDEKCEISSMPQDVSTMVYPGGDTRCIFSDSTPYSFQVIPGSSNKLLFYFQGGGACWDRISTKLKFCSTDVGEQSLTGIFSRDTVSNKFKDYTIVHLNYCSGDVWGGLTERPYNDDNGQPVKQVGYLNAHATLKYVLEQQSSGALASTLDELVIMGCSAGSVGTQLWANEVLNTLSFKYGAVVPDSYAGVFPEDVESSLIADFGFCDTPLISEELRVICKKGQLRLQRINIEHMQAHPTIPFSFIQAKADDVQMAFYMGVAFTNPTNYSRIITPSEFYWGVNSLFSMYNQQSNFITFLVDGMHHCYTNQDLYYDATNLGSKGKLDKLLVVGGEKSIGLESWVNQFPNTADTSYNDGQDYARSACVGLIRKGSKSEFPLYCDRNVYPKELGV